MYMLGSQRVTNQIQNTKDDFWHPLKCSVILNLIFFFFKYKTQHPILQVGFQCQHEY